MNCCRFLLALVLPVAMVLPAPAGIFGKSKVKPAERVPLLIGEVKTDTDANKRESAAKELREYDPKAFPEIVPVLIDVLQHDTNAAVRAEAAQSLSKLRPVSQDVGYVLEEATKDKSMRVRWQARSALMNYRLAGYRSEPKVVEKPVPAANAKAISKVISQKSVVPAVTTGETAPPPLAQTAPKPLPQGLPQPAAVPAVAPKVQKTPAAAPDQGPDLNQ